MPLLLRLGLILVGAFALPFAAFADDAPPCVTEPFSGTPIHFVSMEKDALLNIGFRCYSYLDHSRMASSDLGPTATGEGPPIPIIGLRSSRDFEFPGSPDLLTTSSALIEAHDLWRAGFATGKSIFFLPGGSLIPKCRDFLWLFSVAGYIYSVHEDFGCNTRASSKEYLQFLVTKPGADRSHLNALEALYAPEDEEAPEGAEAAALIVSLTRAGTESGSLKAFVFIIALGLGGAVIIIGLTHMPASWTTKKKKQVQRV